MIIDCIGCLHGAQPKLEGGDLLIVTGDLTANDHVNEYLAFHDWIGKQSYALKVVIAGNHDNILQNTLGFSGKHLPFTYLCDSGTEFEGLKIWGSPWTAQFKGINPKCCAFTVPFGPDMEDRLKDTWRLIPSDTDILITHSPAYGILDGIPSEDGSLFHVGSKSLQMELFERLNPKLFVHSHIHEAYGIEPTGGFVQTAVNCSIMNERYKPVNKPVRIVL